MSTTGQVSPRGCCSCSAADRSSVMSNSTALAPRSPAIRALLASDRQGRGARRGLSSLTMLMNPGSKLSSSLALHRYRGWDCINFPSAGVTSATPANTPSKVRFSFPVGSIFKGITLIIALCSADLSDSTAAANTSPGRPKPACRVAISSQGQRAASCSCWPPLMLPAASMLLGHAYCCHQLIPKAGSQIRQTEGERCASVSESRVRILVLPFSTV